MSIKILTAYTGDAHIESADDGAKFAGIIGTGKYVLNVGSKFEAEIVSNNLIKIKDGDLVNQGRHMRIPVNETVECTIDNGAQSRYRNDLIVARYSKNSNTGIEAVNVVVIKGTASTSSSPADPTYTSGDILNGALTDDFPLYRVRLNGLSITAVEPLFGDPVKSLSELNTDIENTWDTLGNYQIIWRRFFQMSKSGVLSLQNTTITGSFSVESPVAADQLWVIPVGVSYGNLSASPSATQSGGSGTYTINVSADAQNLTTETHTVTVNVLVIAVKTKS